METFQLFRFRSFCTPGATLSDRLGGIFSGSMVRRKLELSRGHASLYKFCIHELGYSEAESLIRIRAMRLVKSLPALEEKLQSGDLSLSNAAEIQNQFRRENERRKKLELEPLRHQEQQKVLYQVEGKSTRECQRTLANAFPEIQMQLQERTKVLADERTIIQFSANRSLVEKLEKLRGLLAHKNFGGSYEGLFEELAEMALTKLDPLQKAAATAEKPNAALPCAPTVKDAKKVKRANQLKEMKQLDEMHHLQAEKQPSISEEQFGKQKAKPSRSRYIPKSVRRAIWQNAKGKCEFVNPTTGTRCDSNHALEIDHIKEFSQGGSSDGTNLRLLCDC